MGLLVSLLRAHACVQLYFLGSSYSVEHLSRAHIFLSFTQI